MHWAFAYKASVGLLPTQLAGQIVMRARPTHLVKVIFRSIPGAPGCSPTTNMPTPSAGPIVRDADELIKSRLEPNRSERYFGRALLEAFFSPKEAAIEMFDSNKGILAEPPPLIATPKILSARPIVSTRGREAQPVKHPERPDSLSLGIPTSKQTISH